MRLFWTMCVGSLHSDVQSTKIGTCVNVGYGSNFMLHSELSLAHANLPRWVRWISQSGDVAIPAITQRRPA